MPRRKTKKRLRRQRSREASPPPRGVVFETSLEEDLRQQRLRQEERRRQEEEKEAEPSAESSSNENYDGTRIVVPQHLISRGLITSLTDITSFSSLHMGYAHEQSPVLSRYNRHRIRQLWHSKYLLEEMEVNRRASSLYSKKYKWPDHSLPDGMHCSWDLACKQTLHPSSRTLDVAQLNTVGGSHDDLPTIATAIQGGWGLLQPSSGRENRIHTFRG